MKKNLLFFAAIMSISFLTSCSGGRKSESVSTATTPEIENATEVMRYYNASLDVLHKMVNEKEINTILGYMELKGKIPSIITIAPPAISDMDTLVLLKPGNCFDEVTQQNLKQDYSGLFCARTQFYTNFDEFLSVLKTKDAATTNQLLKENYRLSKEMSEYKQNVFDILSPYVDKAGQILLTDNPMKDQIMEVRKMTATMQSIVNLYARKPIFERTRIDYKLRELEQQLDAAEKLPAVVGQDTEMKTYRNHLSRVKAFIEKVHKVREKEEYSDADFEVLTSAYETSVI